MKVKTYLKILETSLRIGGYGFSYWIAGWKLVAAEILLELAHNLEHHR